MVEPFFCIEKYFFIQGGRLVCKTWNLFLVNDKKLWMGILRCRQIQLLFEFLNKKLSDEDFANARKTWKEYFDFIEKNDYSCHYLIQNVKRIQKLHVDLQDLSQGMDLFIYGRNCCQFFLPDLPT